MQMQIFHMVRTVSCQYFIQCFFLIVKACLVINYNMVILWLCMSLIKILNALSQQPPPNEFPASLLLTFVLFLYSEIPVYSEIPTCAEGFELTSERRLRNNLNLRDYI